MKKVILFLLILLSENVVAQETDVMAKPSNGKCMVYITRRESAAMLVKFSIYDGDMFLGKLGHKKYFAYECDPGEHVLIAKGENTFYVDTNLEEGKTYVIDLKVKMGIASARVSLVPIDKTHKKYEKEKKKILEFVSQKKGELLSEADDNDESDEEEQDPTANMSKRLQKFYEMKEKGKKITTITPEMSFD